MTKVFASCSKRVNAPIPTDGCPGMNEAPVVRVIRSALGLWSRLEFRGVMSWDDYADGT